MNQIGFLNTIKMIIDAALELGSRSSADGCRYPSGLGMKSSARRHVHFGALHRAQKQMRNAARLLHPDRPRIWNVQPYRRMRLPTEVPVIRRRVLHK